MCGQEDGGGMAIADAASSTKKQPVISCAK